WKLAPFGRILRTRESVRTLWARACDHAHRVGRGLDSPIMGSAAESWPFRARPDGGSIRAGRAPLVRPRVRPRGRAAHPQTRLARRASAPLLRPGGSHRRVGAPDPPANRLRDPLLLGTVGD